MRRGAAALPRQFHHFGAINLIRWMLLGRFRSKASLEAEILALRHQLNVLRRTSPRRAVLSNFDRMIFVCFYRIAPRILVVDRRGSQCVNKSMQS
jgi:hypothetical protein